MAPSASTSHNKSVSRNKRGIARRLEHTKSKESRPTKKVKVLEAEEEEEYLVRDIIGENETQYLVDWEDSSQGQQYSPTWEPKHFVNQVAVDAWESRKTIKDSVEGEQQSSVGTSHTGASTSQDSQPILPPNRRGLYNVRPVAATASPVPGGAARDSSKTGARVSTSHTVQHRKSGSGRVDEIPDSYEEAASSFRIHISADPAFNRDLYEQASFGSSGPPPLSQASIEAQNTDFEVQDHSSGFLAGRFLGNTQRLHSQDERQSRSSGISSQADDNFSTYTCQPSARESQHPSQADTQSTDRSALSPIDIPNSGRSSLSELKYIKDSSSVGLEAQPSSRISSSTSASQVNDSSVYIHPPSQLSQSPWRIEAPYISQLASLHKSTMSQQDSQNLADLTPSQRIKLAREKAAAAVPTIPSPQPSLAEQNSAVANTTGSSTYHAEPSSNGLQRVTCTFSPSHTDASGAFVSAKYVYSSKSPSDVPSGNGLDRASSAQPSGDEPLANTTEVQSPARKRKSFSNGSDDGNLAKKSRRASISSQFENGITVSGATSQQVSPVVEAAQSLINDVDPAITSPKTHVSNNEQEEYAQDDMAADYEEARVLRMPSEPGSYFVLLPMVAIVRELYTKAISQYKASLVAYLNGAHEDRVEADMDNMIEDLKLLCSHQDLVGPLTTSQREMSHVMLSRWSQSISTKCLFLRELLVNLQLSCTEQTIAKHIAILARPGRTLEILESILIDSNITYKRPDTSAQSGIPNSGSGLRVTLLPTGTTGPNFVVDGADAIFAFDTTYHDGERYSRILRENVLDPANPSPLISLAVVNSIEHISLCLSEPSQGLAGRQLKTALVSCAKQTRKEVGLSAYGEHRAGQSAIAVAEWLAHLEDLPEWPLADDEDLIDLELPGAQIPMVSGSTTQSHDDSANGVLDDGTASQNLSAATRIALEDAKRVPQLEQEILDLKKQLEQVKAANITDEAYFKDKMLEAQELRDTSTANVNAFLEQRTYAFERMYKINELTKTLESNERLLEARRNDIVKLKEEKAAVATALNEAKAALQNHSVPEIAEFEKLKAQIAELEATKSKQEKRIANFQNEQNFFRDNYQRSSIQVDELNLKNTELESELEIWKRKADANIVAVHAEDAKFRGEDTARTIKDLKATIEMQQWQMRQLDKQLLEAQRDKGGRNMRGNSTMPGSPRPGTTSRAGSPAAGVVPVSGRFERFRDA